MTPLPYPPGPDSKLTIEDEFEAFNFMNSKMGDYPVMTLEEYLTCPWGIRWKETPGRWYPEHGTFPVRFKTQVSAWKYIATNLTMHGFDGWEAELLPD